MRKFIALAAASLTAAAVGAPAAASTSSTNDVEFTVQSGGLSIAQTYSDTNGDGSINSGDPSKLNSGATLTLGASSVSGNLFPTTVTDSRGELLGNWSVRIGSANGFTNNGGTAVDTSDDHNLPGEKATATIATTTLSVTGGTLVTDYALADGSSVLSGASALTGANLKVTSGANDGTQYGGLLIKGTTAGTGTASYTPTLKVDLSGGAVAGTYKGVVTQTVL